jgi:hypothetical protein
MLPPLGSAIAEKITVAPVTTLSFASRTVATRRVLELLAPAVLTGSEDTSVDRLSFAGVRDTKLMREVVVELPDSAVRFAWPTPEELRSAANRPFASVTPETELWPENRPRVVVRVIGAPTTAAPVPTAAAPAPTTLAPAPTTPSPAGGGTATCDKESVAAGIGDEVADIVDLECVDGWAAAVYTDSDGLSRPAILKAEGQLWVLQDWYAVCEGDPMVPGDIAVPEPLRMYCPGG